MITRNSIPQQLSGKLARTKKGGKCPPYKNARPSKPPRRTQGR